MYYFVCKKWSFTFNNFAAKCLNNSLHKSPKDLTITDAKTINKKR